MTEIKSGAMEAKKLLEEYGLIERTDYECKNADCMTPLDMKKRNEIWISFLDKLYIDMKKQLEARSKIRCEKLKTACYPEYIFEKNKDVCII